MKFALTSLILVLLPSIALANATAANTIGVSPGIIETEMLPEAQLEQQIIVMRSNTGYDESYTVSLDGDTTNLTVHVPEQIVLLHNQQQAEFPLRVSTRNAQPGNYDILVTFTPNNATTELPNAPTANQRIAIGISIKIHITVVNQLSAKTTTEPPVQSMTQPAPLPNEPFWLWLGGSIVILIDVCVGIYWYRQRHSN